MKTRMIAALAVAMLATPALAQQPVTFFGVTLGDSVAKYPMCQQTNITLCRERADPPTAIDRVLSKLGNSETYRIPFLPGTKPDTVAGTGFNALVMDGKIEGVTILTSGVLQRSALRELTDKFGKPTISKIVLTRNGGSLYAAWKVGGYLIMFDGLVKDFNWEQGAIRVTSKKTNDLVEAQRASKPKL